jgi:hypothetical protein
MRFRFLGDLDAPDWILAEVAILSKMSSIRMKLLCRQIILQVLGKTPQADKINKLTTSTRIQLDSRDIKALLAALFFIFQNAGKNDVDPDILNRELQQLGLPVDICTAICKEYGATREEIRAHLLTETLSFPQVQDIDWRVDYSISSTVLKTTPQATVAMQWHLSKPINGSKSVSFDMTSDKFKVLYQELITARQMMKAVQ